MIDQDIFLSIQVSLKKWQACMSMSSNQSLIACPSAFYFLEILVKSPKTIQKESETKVKVPKLFILLLKLLKLLLAIFWSIHEKILTPWTIGFFLDSSGT